MNVHPLSTETRIRDSTPRVYGDLENLHDGTCKNLQLPDETWIRHLDKGRLVSWIAEDLLEMKV